MRVGDKVKVISDNKSYDDFRDEVLIVTHAEVGGLGYDESIYPQVLMCFKTENGNDIPFSLYEYEVEQI